MESETDTYQQRNMPSANDFSTSELSPTGLGTKLCQQTQSKTVLPDISSLEPEIDSYNQTNSYNNTPSNHSSSHADTESFRSTDDESVAPEEVIDGPDTEQHNDTRNRMPNYLSTEESNYLRFCHLIQKVAPQAVRCRFDQEFPDLDATINTQMPILFDLKQKRVITKTQWNLLLPYGSTAVSTDFDVTLMICLLRHLSSIEPMSGDYDTLPPTSDVSLGADLARVKYHRNRIAHSLDRTIDNFEFPIIWDSLSKAISRIGGQKYYQECNSLRVSSLDSSYLDIHREVLLKEVQLKEQMAEMERKLKDPIPPNERENWDLIIQQWRLKDKHFVETTGSKALNIVLKTEPVVIVAGSPGTGKSYTTQHTLLSLNDTGFNIIPVTSSTHMVRYFSRQHRQIFYIDNICGKYNISSYDIEEWERNKDRISDMFTSPLTKCVFTCRLQIYQDPKFMNLNLANVTVVNLSGSYQLTLDEKISVGKKYLSKDVLKCISNDTITQSECFPLLCLLYDKHSNESAVFFEKPKSYFETELDELKNKPDKLKYACIALCVMFNDNVTDEIFTESADATTSNRLKVTLEECEVNTSTPKKTIISQFESMVGTYFQKNETGYRSIHDYMFDIYCSHVSTFMLQCVIEHADSGLLSDRALLQSLGEDKEEFTIIIPTYMEPVFIKRVVKDIKNNKIWDVYFSRQFKHAQNLSQLLEMNKDIINYTDEDGVTALHLASYNGCSGFVNMLCNKGGNVNQCDEGGFTPLYAASQKGHSDIVDILCNRGGNVNQCTKNGYTPLFVASQEGHGDIVDKLCNRGGNINQCSNDGHTPLLYAAFNGHKTCVNMLLNRGAAINACNNEGFTPLHVASQEGHSNIVDMLCNRGGNVYQCTNDGYTPLMSAAFNGHITCVDVLLNRGAAINTSNNDGFTPLHIASQEGHSDIVDLLCNRGGNVNQCDNDGYTPFHTATKKGHDGIVDMLLERGALNVVDTNSQL